MLFLWPSFYVNAIFAEQTSNQRITNTLSSWSIGDAIAEGNLAWGPSIPAPGYVLQTLLTNTFYRNFDLNGFRGLAQIHRDTEILQFDFRFSFKAHPVTTPRVRAVPQHFSL